MTAATSRSSQLATMMIRLCSMLSFLICEEFSGLLTAEITFQKSGVGLRKVDNDESVEGIGKLAVDTEAKQLSAKLQVLPQQHGDADLGGLDVRHCGREVVYIERLHRGRQLAALSQTFARQDQMFKRGHRRVTLEEGHHECAGGRTVLVADADWSEQHCVAWIHRDEFPDAFP